MTFLYTIYLFILSLLLALIEIEIEGKNGWAAKTETFRKDLTKIRFIKKVTWSRELTGYHLFLNVFLVMLFHMPYFFGFPLTLANEFLILGYYLLFGVTWDFSWFVLNPFYGIAKFKKDQIPWFSQNKWIFSNRVSVPHLLHLACGLIFISGAVIIKNDLGILLDYLLSIGLFVALSIATILLSPNYHKLYFKLRKPSSNS